MQLFATLLLGHLIADFPLQTDWVVQFKKRHITGLALHAGIHMGVTALLILDPLRHWPILAILGLAHFATDWLKLRVTVRPQAPGFLIDQAAHLGVIVLIARWASELAVVLPSWVLYPAALVGMAPAIAMFLLILANDLGQGMGNGSGRIQQVRRQMRRLYHLAGLLVLMIVIIGRLMTLILKVPD